MYRCHFMQAGRIVQGLNLKVETLDAAIATGRKILADHIELIDCDGLEIWLDSALLYTPETRGPGGNKYSARPDRSGVSAPERLP